MRFLGFAGPAGSGKDTAAALIRSEGWMQSAYADPLREFLMEVDPIVGLNGDHGEASIVHLSDVIDFYGWQGYKETKWGPEIRRLIQRTGTEGGRGIIGEQVWIDTLFKRLDPYGRHVISDVRFPNEAQAIRDRGGKVFWISRPDLKPINVHVSEHSLTALDCDDIITNDGSLQALRYRLLHAILVDQDS